MCEAPILPETKQPVGMNECVYVYPKTQKLRAYIGKRDREREREKRDSEHKDSTNTWMGVVHERKRAREK